MYIMFKKKQWSFAIRVWFGLTLPPVMVKDHIFTFFSSPVKMDSQKCCFVNKIKLLESCHFTFAFNRKKPIQFCLFIEGI